MKVFAKEKTNLVTTRGKRSLTILELFVCLGILALVGSLVIFKSRPMIAKYRFESSASRLAKELEWTHKVAMSAGADMDVTIEQKKDHLVCKRQTDEPLGFRGGNQTFKVEHIPHFLFNDEVASPLKLTFTRSGTILPEGTLKIVSSNETIFFEISLDPTKRSQITLVAPST